MRKSEIQFYSIHKSIAVKDVLTPQNPHRIVKEKPPEQHRSTAKHPHVVTDYGLTCGQTQKTGLFQPQFGKEQAHLIYRENASFRELLQENKRKSGILRLPIFGLSDKT